jgi:hypothetical protein
MKTAMRMKKTAMKMRTRKTTRMKRNSPEA